MGPLKRSSSVAQRLFTGHRRYIAYLKQRLYKAVCGSRGSCAKPANLPKESERTHLEATRQPLISFKSVDASLAAASVTKP